MSTPTLRRILLIDAYDSFTYNLSAQISQCTSAEVHTIRIDYPFTSIVSLTPFLPSFDAVVIGPGPGSPENNQDVGIVKKIWCLADDHILPVFGVCLGLQSLCLAFGGRVVRLHTVKHGLTSPIRHRAVDLFEGVGRMTAVRYHSLHAQLENGKCDEMEALAWADDVENGEVLMAARHKNKPFWAVQYHPESICTEGSDRVIDNFWRLACAWNKSHGRIVVELPKSWRVFPREPSLLAQLHNSSLGTTVKLPPVMKVQTMSMFARGLDIRRICEALGVETSQEFVLLESAAVPGRWSIIAVLTPNISQLIHYTVGDDFIVLSRVGGGPKANIQLEQPFNSAVWQYLALFMREHRAIGGEPLSPFWGGLVGYFSYEIGVESLSIPLSHQKKRHADVNLAFAERSIVIDSLTGQIFIQSLFPDDSTWLESIKVLLQQEHDLSLTPSATPPPTLNALKCFDSYYQKWHGEPVVVKPSQKNYEALVRDCQSYLASGDSYELCLTARTLVSLPSPQPSEWSLYNLLRVRNAAPYAAYIRLQGVTILSSSPERFLSYSRNGKVQLRPIKGTVKKSSAMTREMAESILNTPKERAENMMILDLIRHDLHRILGSGKVTVSQLMSVEEYASVYQLVSVIEGDIPSGQDEDRTPVTGLDILASSLPPGSMTGAPKKRSVEILQTLESEEERGIYSGVLGYMSVCGAGDWSVIIRSAYRYDYEGKGQWWVGAGGAVTALSTPQGEWEEMMVKLESTLSAFCR
jgi:para-aminobenzoate synthetase